MIYGRIAIALAVLALLAGIFFAGVSVGTDRERGVWEARERARVEQIVQAQRDEARAAVRRADATHEIGKTLTRTVEVERVVTLEITREIPVLIPAGSVPAAVRLLHDAAALGVAPRDLAAAAAGVDAEAVPLEDLAATVAANYGQCRVDQARLVSLQEYVDKIVGDSNGQP